MCGIYVTNIPFQKEEVRKKLESVKFRGPDFTGVTSKNGLIFGHLRLAILDLDPRSNQPMCEDEFTIVFNGEIYNFESVKKELEEEGVLFHTTSDTEVLLKGFKLWGEALLPKLNGMFAFAIYDKVKDKIYCYRDRLGVKPFYYSWNEKGEFEICSQLRPISQNKEINEEALSVYLDSGYIPSPLTIFKDVHKLCPGKCLVIDVKNRNYETTSFWELGLVKQTQKSYEEAKEELHELLIDAVKIRLKSDVPFGTFLSGGVDSALITSIAQKVSEEKIRTFSIGFEDPEYDESKIATQFSKIIGTEHNQTMCKASDTLQLLPKLIEVYDEPFADSSALPSLLLNKVTTEYVTMALSGDGGDESFLGYNHFSWLKNVEKLFKIPLFIRKIMAFFITEKIFKGRAKPLKHVLRLKKAIDFIPEIFVGLNRLTISKKTNWLNRYKNYKSNSSELLQQAADLNISLWLEADSNVKVDRASMAYSVEVRSPFLDYRIVEFARTLPVAYRFDKNIRKKMLRDILKEYIPEKVFNQPKKGFSVPIKKWIREDLKEDFIANLSEDFLNSVPNLDVKKFKKMLKLHMQGKHNYTAYIWRLYVLSRWYQEFGYYKKAS